MASSVLRASSSIANVREVPGAANALASSPSALQHICHQACQWHLSRLCAQQQKVKYLSTRRSRASSVVCTLLEDDIVLQPNTPASKNDAASLRLMTSLSDLKAITDARQRAGKVLNYASQLPAFPESLRMSENRVMGCTARVWLTADLGKDGKMYFAADSDSELTKGFCAILIQALNGARPAEVLAVSLDTLGAVGSGLFGGTASRANSWYNVLLTMQKKTQMALAQARGGTVVEPFPSLLVTADDLIAQGSFAQAQAKYLLPDKLKVQELASLLKEKQIGVVAHFYMDPEVQGVLAAAKSLWPHIHISDSLVMADRAVKMADQGCKHIAVLGVDFMSENVRAILDRAGHEQVNVYRMSSERIGCSLAEAAESDTYLKFLEDASSSTPALHVIYINTSLETKARAHAIVPTITCTSSNVVQTVLQAFAQVPDVTVWYGPDSYMGANLAEMFRQMANMSDEEIASIHPLHNKHSILSLLPRLHYYHDGTCIVHDLFGHEVVSRVRKAYCDAFLTAHFEVPGEMFALAMEAKQRGMGVVGSTQNILDFITQHVQEAVNHDFDDKIQFVLGTEAGMVTAIVGAVRKILIDGRSKGSEAKIEVEIVFPVSSDSISTVSSSSMSHSAPKRKLSNLSVVPGVSSGEGCSVSGGCASCPYMKMNSLDALLRVCHLVNTPMGHVLALQQASRFNTSNIAGHSVAELGCEPILHMRHFQSEKTLPQALVDQIVR